MNLRTHLVAFICVLAVAVGQVLFKKLAILFSMTKTIWSFQFVGIGLAAILIYLGATIGWVWLLQYESLSRVYPYFALSFVLVPIAGVLLFGDTLSWQYYSGIVLVVAGVLLTQNIYEP